MSSLRGVEMRIFCRPTCVCSESWAVEMRRLASSAASGQRAKIRVRLANQLCLAAQVVVGSLECGVGNGTRSASLLVHLPLVELELLALKDVAVGANALARAGGDASEDSAALELVSDSRVNDAVLLGSLELGLHVTGGLLGSALLVGLLLLLGV